MIEKLVVEKTKLEQELRRQSQQFRDAIEEREANVQVNHPFFNMRRASRTLYNKASYISFH
jgi:hypothetical protein